MPVIPVDLGDPRLAAYRSVRDPDLANRLGLFVAEGRLVVERLIAADRYEIESVLVTEVSFAAIRPSLDRVGEAVPVFLARQSDLQALTGFNLHRGCLALARRPTDQSLRSIVADAHVVMVLDAIADADNVGTVFRNAWALGADAVVLGPTTCDPLYRKAIRTSMAAALLVPFARSLEWPTDLESMTALGFELVALTPHPNAETLEEFTRRRLSHRRLALLLGAEGPGLSAEVLALAETRIRIPMRPGVDSLNVSVASAIALAALGRL